MSTSAEKQLKLDMMQIVKAEIMVKNINFKIGLLSVRSSFPKNIIGFCGRTDEYLEMILRKEV